MKRFLPLLLLVTLTVCILTGCGAPADDEILYLPPAESWQGDPPQDVLDLLTGCGHTLSLLSTEPSILHGQRYHVELDGSKLHAAAVYRYESAAAAQAEADCIGADGYSFIFPAEDDTVEIVEVSWVDAPHFYLDGERIILYIGQDQAILTALEGAFGAPFAGAAVAADCGTE